MGKVGRDQEERKEGQHYFYFLCKDASLAFVTMCHIHDSSELPCGCREFSLGSPEEHPVLLPTELGLAAYVLVLD